MRRKLRAAPASVPARSAMERTADPRYPARAVAMGHSRFAFALVAFLAACGSGDESPATKSTDAGIDAPAPTRASFAVEQTFTIANANGGHLAFPDLARLKDGQLLLVYRQGASHVDASGRIMKQFGSANGTTWSDPEVLYDAPGIDDRDPSVVALSGGDVVVSYFQYKTMALPDGTMAVHHIFVGRSVDDGKTFGPFAQIDGGSMSPSGPHLDSAGRWVDDQNQALVVRACSSPIVELGGQLVLPSYGGNPLNLSNLAATPKSRISLLVSKDGQTFSEQPILTDAVPDVWLQEPALLPLESGTTLLQMRTASGSSPSNPGKLMQSASTDLQAWSEPTSMPFVGHAPSLAELSSGLVLSAYRELDDAFTEEWVSLSWSLDDGATFSAPIQVADCGGVECGYPSIAELDSERFLLVYYAPGGAAIEGVIYHYTLS